MTRAEQPTPLPSSAKEIAESREQPLPDGVFLVLLKRRVTGLHVHPSGVALLSAPGAAWQPQQPVTKIRRAKLIRSRVRITFADGSKIRVRPFKPGLKGMLDVGQKDSWGTMPSPGNDRGGNTATDPFAAAFVILAAVVLFPISLFFLIRELAGTSARAKQAALLIERIRAVSG